MTADRVRLVLRRLDIDEALNRAGGDYLVIAALRSVIASSGQKIETTVVAKSKTRIDIVSVGFRYKFGSDAVEKMPEAVVKP